MERPAPAGSSWVSAPVSGGARATSDVRVATGTGDRPCEDEDQGVRRDGCPQGHGDDNTVMIAVLPEGGREPTLVKRLSHDPRRLRRMLHRAGELVTIRVPTEREERVRDLVRCRGTLQREILKSRHYILKFLAHRGVVYREGKNWTGRHWAWLDRSSLMRCWRPRPGPLRGVPRTPGLQAGPSRRAGPPDRGAGIGANLKRTGRSLVLPEGDLDASSDGAGDRDRGLPAVRTSGQTDGLRRAGAERALERRDSSPGVDREGGQQPGPACAGACGVVLPLPASSRGGAEATPRGPAAGCGHPQLEGRQRRPRPPRPPPSPSRPP